jgi:hypothetical protein
VTARSDDDALSWGDEDDPTLHVGPSSARPTPAPTDEPAAAAPVLPDGYVAVGKGAETVQPQPEKHAPALGNVALLVVGVLGGIYLLSTIGWVVGGLRLKGAADFLVAPAAYQVSLWLAVAAPAIWFLTVLWLTAGSRVWVRFAWLIGGAALLLPWPFIMVGAVGR